MKKINKTKLVLVKAVKGLSFTSFFFFTIVAFASMVMILRNLSIEDRTWIVVLAENKEVLISAVMLFTALPAMLLSGAIHSWFDSISNRLSN